ncbi:MAG: tetratricopeptide repeat protein [Helicobacteraceae bacterium]|jgi:Flp pilus assembly protein TadD|nr:tetratricopeptide repeat protein [Helicobacteraceae bacterium]
MKTAGKIILALFVAAVLAFADSAVERGGAAYERGDYQEAVKQYSIAIKESPKNPHRYAMRGVAYSQLGKYSSAITDFNQAIKLGYSDAFAHFSRGFAYDRSGDYATAITDYTQAIKLNPSEAIYYASRGLAYQQLSEHSRAIADFDQAIRLDPSQAHVYGLREYSTRALQAQYALQYPPHYNGGATSDPRIELLQKQIEDRRAREREDREDKRLREFGRCLNGGLCW